MAYDDPKLLQRMAPLLQRVLIVDPQPMAARVLSDLLRNLVSGAQCWTAPSAAKALAAAESENPQIIFVEMSGPEIDGCKFTRALRRSHMRCRQVPVIMMTAQATAGGILAARDAGVHEFLRKPFTTKDVVLRLEAVALKPRDWIEAVAYIGPDRRRFNSADYSGARKRHADKEAPTETARLLQALRILKAAVGAIDRDRDQAVRAMKAQIDEIKRIAQATDNAALSQAVTTLRTYVTQAGGQLDAAGLARSAAGLLAMLPADAPKSINAA
jgi:CheY-like chemotaxis protein